MTCAKKFHYYVTVLYKVCYYEDLSRKDCVIVCVVRLHKVTQVELVE